MKKNILIISGIIVFIAFCFLVIISLGQKKVTYTETSPKEPERGSSASTLIVINNMGKLSDILLASQFTASQTVLNDYVNSLSSKPTNATLKEVSVRNDGILLCNIALDNPIRTLKVEINRSIFDKITVTIPTEKFTKTVVVYAGTPED